MKAIFLSIKSKHALNILEGRKTLELRTRIPKEIMLQIKNKEIEGIWVYGYVTKGYPLLNHIDNKYKLMDRKNHTIFHNIGMYEFYNDDIHLNGTIPFRFWFDEYIAYKYYADDNSYFAKRSQDFGYHAEEVLKRLCLTRDEFKAYGKGKDLYAWHIKKLEIFDKPMELIDFVSDKLVVNVCGNEFKCYSETASYFARKDQRLTKAPQSYQYVWVQERK